MTEQELALKFNDHDHEIKSLKHRVSDVEKKQTEIETLTLSVSKLAVNMQHMLEEQREQNQRLKALESAPADEVKTIHKTLLTAVITTVVGAIVGAILALIIH
jgi:chromosome segregation ATPase